MTGKKKFYNHLKAFLVSHQIGDDPEHNLAKAKRIAHLSPDKWDGKISLKGFKPDLSVCKVIESTRSRPIIPWWWYAEQNEPIPSVVRDIYGKVTFDFAVVFPRHNAWLYVLCEPTRSVIDVIENQDHIRAFILISLVNKNFAVKQRKSKRLRLGRVMGSEDMRRIFVFTALREEDPLSRSLAVNIPSITRVIQKTANTTDWNIRLPGVKQSFGSFQDVIPMV